MEAGDRVNPEKGSWELADPVCQTGRTAGKSPPETDPPVPHRATILNWFL